MTTMRHPSFHSFETAGWKPERKISNVCALSNGNLISVDADNPKKIRIWNRKGKNILKYKSPISCYEIFPLQDGRILYGNPFKKRIFSPINNQSLPIFPDNLHLSTAISWKKHGLLCISGNGHHYQIEILDIRPPQLKSINKLSIQGIPIALTITQEEEIMVGLNTGDIQCWAKNAEGRFAYKNKIPTPFQEYIEKKFLVILSNEILADINIGLSKTFIRYLKKSNNQWQCAYMISLPDINSKTCRPGRDALYFHSGHSHELCILDLHCPTQIHKLGMKHHIHAMTSSWGRIVLASENRISIHDERDAAIKECLYQYTPFCSNIANMVLNYCHDKHYQPHFFSNKARPIFNAQCDEAFPQLLKSPSKC